jgi:carboxyl-terminal processing protease
MSRSNLYWLLGITAITLFGLSLTYTAARARQKATENKRDYEAADLLMNVLHEVRERYVIDIDSDRERKLVEDMINGGLERLDPHSAYINPRAYKQFDKQSEGKFGGIGIQVGLDGPARNQLSVVTPMVGTPAFDAGVQAGDLILKIDGKPTSNMRMEDAVDLIQGDPGQKIVLTILHEGAKEPVDIAITRAIITLPSVLGDLRKPGNPPEWDYLIDRENKIGYVRLTTFAKTAPAELRAAIELMQKEGARGVVLDLRNNPGGLLKSAVEISDLFLTEGKIVSTKGRNHRDEVYEAKAAGTLLTPYEKYPMVVLINKYSASASEIVAAALQDHERAVVIGERSYGKGSVQNIILMEKDTSALKLTTASYWRPSGKNIHRFPESKESDEWGVKPNAGFEVPMKDEERIEYLRYRADRDIVRSKPKPADKEAKEKKPPFVDRALEKALEHLRKEVKKAEAIPEKKDV